MRIATTIALAAIGVLALALPCAAQSRAVSEAPKTSYVPKQVAPQRLGPPESPAPKVADTAADKAAREDVQPLSPQPAVAAPQAVTRQRVLSSPQPAPQQPAPQPAYAAPVQTTPTFAPPQQTQQQPPQSAFSSPDRLMDWVSNYRKKPDLWNVPPAVHAMLDYGLFGDEEKQWFCIGFIAGVLGTNPHDGPALVARMFPMPDKEQEVIIRAIVYSGRPDWRTLLEKNSSRMPLRRPLIDDFLNNKRPALMDLPLEQGGAPGIYALWGYYVATGQHQPVMRIMKALKWSKNDEDSNFSFRKIFTGWSTDPSAVDKISTGGTAKWTLASYAERDRELIRLYRAEYERQPPEVAKPLKDVIEAAELFESEKIRKDQFGAIEDAQKRQMSAEAGMSKGMTAGSLAIATGCVAATALGQAQITLPCVIGGALFTGAGKLAR
ncbi:MAG TPA: hypothetical protein VMW57_00200 [Methyloceanibacter sp.]|nr:hypothetical protein [Methyloceanibacter sp.]